MKTMSIPSITVTQVAKRFNRTTGRIRQICIEHNIGTLVGGRVRVFTPKQVAIIEAIILSDRRKKVESSVDE